MSADSSALETPGLKRRRGLRPPGLEAPRGFWRSGLERWRGVSVPELPRRATWPIGLRRLWLAGFAVLLAELIGFCVWNQLEVNHFLLNQDFASYAQVMHMLLHGNLGLNGSAGFMQTSSGASSSFWKIEAELDVIPQGLLFAAWPHLVLLKWLQSLELVGAQAIAFTWMCELVAIRQRDDREVGAFRWLPAVGLLLLVLNPWFIWSSSFDVHPEPFAALFVLAAARDMYFGRRRAWIWAVCGILGSAVGATYVATAALGIALSGRVRAKLALSITAAAVFWFVLLTALGLVTVGGALNYYSILNGGATDLNNVTQAELVGQHVTYGSILHAALHHPLNVPKALWGNHANLWAPVSSAGIIGFIWPPALITTVVVLLEGGFARGFSLPSFQNIVIAPLIAVGTVAVLLTLAERRRSMRGRLLLALATTAIVVNSVVWAIIWFPQVTNQWDRVTPQAARVLAQVRDKIGPNDEVAVSQGMAGGFGNRQSVYTLFAHITKMRLSGSRVWFIIAPDQGIEVWDASEALAAISQLRHTPGVHLVEARDGIWVFNWLPPHGQHWFFLGTNGAVTAPGSAVAGASGVPVRTRVESHSYAASTGEPGYVVDQAYVREMPGTYGSTVRLSAAAPANVELWDATTSTLLGRVHVEPRLGIRDVTVRARLRSVVGQSSYGGIGPWSIAPVTLPADELETRVWAGAGVRGAIKVYSVRLAPYTG